MNDVLKPCQYAFFYNRMYDPEENTIRYLCQKNGAVIKLMNDCPSIDELCTMDKKALATIMAYCREKCSYYHNSCI